MRADESALVLNSNAMAGTPIDLYRSGNASSACMQRVRLKPPPDVDHYTDVHGDVWVKVDTGGASTWDAPDPTWSGRPWKAPAGSPVPSRLKVWSDGDGHWLWGPTRDMLLTDYCQALEEANALFSRV